MLQKYEKSNIIRKWLLICKWVECTSGINKRLRENSIKGLQSPPPTRAGVAETVSWKCRPYPPPPPPHRVIPRTEPAVRRQHQLRVVTGARVTLCGAMHWWSHLCCWTCEWEGERAETRGRGGEEGRADEWKKRGREIECKRGSERQKTHTHLNTSIHTSIYVYTNI